MPICAPPKLCSVSLGGEIGHGIAVQCAIELNITFHTHWYTSNIMSQPYDVFAAIRLTVSIPTL